MKVTQRDVRGALEGLGEGGAADGRLSVQQLESSRPPSGSPLQNVSPLLLPLCSTPVLVQGIAALPPAGTPASKRACIRQGVVIRQPFPPPVRNHNHHLE